ncbi:VanZ family protein [Acetobacterium wieringae]|uniref:VanZ like family protein n=1 Tax=Acetobacterium wieringae TaxID=52694 RepID=A0A1F2PCR7_9FIRM|nr:VanZ family protein [Acetobacterium wieringae]OFV69048.1 VanZ like family protein [Acetobacterium wieringae]
MSGLQVYYNFFMQSGPFSSRKTMVFTVLVILILISLLILNKEKWTTQEKCFKTAVWFYLYLIFLYTFLSRTGKGDMDYNLTPFWSYQHIFSTHEFRIVLEVLFNCLMFIPVGILVPWAYENFLHEDEVKKRNTVLLFGLIVSVSVECLQLFTRTGLFEWDDIFHNMIGLMLGYGIYLFLKGKQFWEVHRYFLPMIGVVLALMIAMV